MSDRRVAQSFLGNHQGVDPAPCVTCERRIPEVDPVCVVCRSKLAGWLAQMPFLATDLQREDWLAPDVRLRNDQRPADPISALLPSTAVVSQSRNGPVSGSKQRQLPINVDAIDLTSPNRPASITVPLTEDTAGFLSYETVLNYWAKDILTRWMGKRFYLYGEPVVVFLHRRLDYITNNYPRIVEFFNDVRVKRSEMYSRAGYTDKPEKKLVQCWQCDTVGGLRRFNGSDYIECEFCGDALHVEEYDKYLAMMVVYLKVKRDEERKKKTTKDLTLVE